LYRWRRSTSSTKEHDVPTGKVKFFSPEKGFGFISYDEGDDVFVHSDALPEGVTELKKGQRVEFGVVSGRKGNQAMQVRLLDPVPSVARAVVRSERKPAEDLAPLVEDLIKVLDGVGESLRRGRYPERAEARQIAGLLRGFAGELEA
jgi:CspA family cold shock protein